MYLWDGPAPGSVCHATRGTTPPSQCGSYFQSEATKDLKEDLKRGGRKHWWPQDQPWTREAWKRACKACVATKKTERLKCTSGITEISWNAFKVMAKVCRENGSEEHNKTQWMRKVFGDMSDQVRNVHTDFLNHVVAETEGRGAITFTFVFEH